MTPSPRAIVGVDVGGTFTDLFWFDEREKRFRVAKVPSRRGDEAAGFIAGLASFGPVSGLASIVHGTTVGTNALLERKGAKVGVITTPGFRDVLEMRRRDRRQTWGLWGEFTPVASRDCRLEVPERTLADGAIRTAVDLDAVRAAALALAARGCEALAIIFINAYANPANERAALEAARAVWPNEHVGCSSVILPEIREFERASTTALNATLQPLVGSYLGRLERALAEDGFTGRFHIVQSNGGVMSTATARRLPVRTALSGPAAGVIAAAAIARAAGYPDVITGDLGGTSFDVSLIAGGQAALAAQSTIAFGLVIRTPMIEITTIGAGGGSIARVDAGGLLEVGPESAGSRPGPVCYGQGADRPTLTDANLVLGRIDGSKPLGTLQRLDAEAAREAIRLRIGQPLGLDVTAAAEAIVKVANARMAGAIRLVSIERGHDPGRFMAMPFGGGGALHAGALIAEVGLRGALVPRFPGVTSALGCVIADIRHDGVQTLNLMLDGLDAAALDARMVAAGREAQAMVADAGLTVSRIDVLYELDMHYLGQTHTVAVPLPVTLHDSPPPRGEGLGVGGEGQEHPAYASGPDATASASNPLTRSSAPHPNPSPQGGGAPAPFATTGVTAAIILAAFEAAYGAAFSRLLPGIPVRIVTLRTAAIGRRPVFDLAALAPDSGATLAAARRGSRPVYLDGRWRETAIWSRLDLPVGARIAGPAMLEQSDATILLDPGLTAEVDRLGNLVILRS